MADPLAPNELFSHVEDAPYFHLPRALAPEGSDGHIVIPQPFALQQPLIEVNTGNEVIDNIFQPLDLKITKL